MRFAIPCGLLAALLSAGAARAADVTIAPGEERTLGDDVVLDGADVLAAGDAAGARCTIHGNGHNIHTGAAWTGSFTMRNCDIDGLGVDGGNAIELAGSGPVVMASNIFSTSATIALTLRNMNVQFQDNVIRADAVVRTVQAAADSRGAFEAIGPSTGTSLFQGNVILKSGVLFQSTNGWLIGGDTPAQGNVLVGLRAGIALINSTDMIVRGNYSHTLSGGPLEGSLGWNQVKNFNVTLGGGTILVEHNVFRGLNWLVELNGPVEFRYNLLFEAVERGWVLAYADNDMKLHHNVLIATKDHPYTPAGVFVMEDGGDGAGQNLDIYNNTADAGGVCDPVVLQGAVVLHDTAVLHSLRSNAFAGVRLTEQAGDALVRAPSVVEPMPPLLDYADYNLYFNPDSPVKDVYGVGVAGKTVRADPGFGLHDVPAGGAPNQQVDPGFAGPVPKIFPFSDDDLIARRTTVCQVLAYYRSVYAPGATSPLTDAGDPQDGDGNDVGAIGAGAPNALDRFGTLCDPADIGQPALAADAYQCMPIVIDPNAVSGGGGGAGVPVHHGLACVCELSADRPSPASLAALVAALVVACRARGRRKARDWGKPGD